jgi:hypothetical protein
MQPTTLDAMRALLKTDPSLSPADRSQIVETIRSHGRPKEQAPKPTIEPRVARVLTRTEVGKRFGRSLRFVDKLAAQGVIHRVTMPGRVRACGFREDEVNRVMNGEVL